MTLRRRRFMTLRRSQGDRWPILAYVTVISALIALGVLSWPVLLTANAPLNVARTRVPRRVAAIARVADTIAGISPHDGNQVILYLLAIQRNEPRENFSTTTIELGDTILWLSPEEWQAVINHIASRHSARFLQAQRQHEAVEVINQAGGCTVYECYTTARHWWRDGWHPPEPRYLWNDWTTMNLLSAPWIVQLPLQHVYPQREIRDPDSVLAHVAGFTYLNSLDLYSSQVTDAGVAHLKGLTNLQHLDLRNTGITDAGVEHLKSLAQLRSLWLHGTKVTFKGVRKLQEALPSCEIRR